MVQGGQMSISSAAPACRCGAVPQAALEALAVHSRAKGMCLMLLDVHGQVLWHDNSAGPFYEAYVLAALRQGQPEGTDLRRMAGELKVHSPPQAWALVPGAALAALPIGERRHVQGVLVLAGRRDDFALGQQALRACGQVGLDPAWLEQAALRMPPCRAEHVVADLAMLGSILRQQLRSGVLEQELRSLSTQLSNTYEELALIDQVSGGMRVNRSSSDFFRQVCVEVTRVICVRGMGVALGSGRLREEPVFYGEMSLLPEPLRRLGEQLLTAMMHRKSPMLVNKLAGDRGYHWLAGSASRLIAVPLLRGDQVLGCLFGLDKVGGDFDSVDTKLLMAIANESAIYLENAMLFGDAHDLLMGMLHSLTSAVDAKDAYTCGHSERVALLARRLGMKLGLPDQEIEKLYMAGLLHDVGKIGVPESVLQKSGKLTVEEFELIKKHPEIGARILADVKQMEEVMPGVMHHHERYDGRGYPAGLAGKDIPCMGRIICLADCFDAMTSSRTYRKALPLEMALAEIRRCAGTQFDPALAEVFLQIKPEEFRELLQEHRKQGKRLLELQESLKAA
jgi:HD-GYP domain-containing protein (c-di-GMP phosphodiesterase class II)